jgi:hypothetical protein
MTNVQIVWSLRLLPYFVIAAGELFAQSDRGTITGTVTDQAGAAVPAAHVMVTHTSTQVKLTTTSNGAGEYSLPSMPVGTYRVVVESPGFKTSVHDNAILDAGTTLRVDTKLEVGTVQQSVEVMASTTMLTTDDAKLRNEISGKLIADLPTAVAGNLRGPFDLANLTPGVQGTDTDVRVAGGQQGSWGATLDGGSITGNRYGSAVWSNINSPSLDAIDQFTVDTNGFKAEYGRAGGGLVSFVSKSGTNQFHGDAYEFIRNNFFDARGFFAKTVAIYRQHDFGGVVGGPVLLPKLYNGRDKTFFFVAYEGFRNRVGAPTTPIAVPPLEFYSGDFHNLVANAKNASGNYIPITIYDPSTTTFNGTQYVRTPFPNNQIPQNRIDPTSAALLALAKQTMSVNLRTDVVPGTWQYWQQNQYQSGSTINPNDKFSVKIDHDLHDKNRFSFYFGYNKKNSIPGPGGAPGIPGILNGFQYDPPQSLVYRGSWDYTITPRMHNRLSVSVTDFHEPILPLAWNGGWKDKGICIQNVPNCDINLPMVSFNDGTFPTWGGFGWNGWGSPTFSISEEFSWTKGKHVVKAGYQYEWTNYESIGNQNVSGQVGFTGAYTALPNTSNTGTAFASFLLGDVSSSTVTTPRFFLLRFNYDAYFIQDDWRVTPKLTLNLGLRYEYDPPTTITGNQCSDFSPTTPNPGAGGRLGALLFCGNGNPNTYLNASGPSGWYKGFGPRFGFAWNPIGKTVVRGGAGISYAPLKVTSGSSHFDGFAFLGTPPGGSDQSGGITPAFQLNNGMPAWPKPPLVDTTFDNNNSIYWWQGSEAMRLPENINWNFTVQRELPKGFLLETGYAASIGEHLLSNELDYNRININNLPANLSIFTNAGRTLLNTPFNSTSINLAANGFTVPYAGFPTGSTLDQALRPYPQYTAVNTAISGDHSGHSTYHSLVTKVTRRFSHGLVIDSSYVFSKMFDDTENAGNNTGGTSSNQAALDAYNRQLDKHVSLSDRTHDAKINWVYELPIGQGKAFLKRGLLSQVIGGWRIGTTQRYASGTPIALTGAFAFPGNTINNRPTITTYNNWRAPQAGSRFDPAVDSFFQLNTLANWNGDVPTITQQGWFPLQPRNQVGNMTVTNPDVRNFAVLSENIALAKTFSLAHESKRELDVRLEAFNLLNRVQFGTPNTNLSGTPGTFGQVTTQANAPRSMQLALKLVF